MGAMRIAQTASYGVLPSIDLPNTFLAQAYDLDDEWGPSSGPCFASSRSNNPDGDHWSCCASSNGPYNATHCAGRESLCATACAAQVDTPIAMSGIHPRSKKEVGDRLGRAAYNTVYGGSGAATGPTLSSCAVTGSALTINFNATLLRGDTLAPLPPRFPPWHASMSSGGTQLWVQTNATLFCMEPLCLRNVTSGACEHVDPKNPKSAVAEYCPTWAGGDGVTVMPAGTFDASSSWFMLNYTLASSGAAIVVDLAPLKGVQPTAVRYAWGVIDCCDWTDSATYVQHGCIASCPIMSSSGLPANPFQAQIAESVCKCVAPQAC